MTNNTEITPDESNTVPGAGIVFDPNSGISEEEQREILAKINGIAEKNRRALAEGSAAEAGKKRRFKAKKSGSLFPALVNAAALVLLAGGIALLSSFQSKTDTQVREGVRVYNSAERALIDEIRKETSSRIAAKENEIAIIVSQLERVDAELQNLNSSNDELNAEQQTTEKQLLALQEEYRSALASLRDERSRILEEARAREAVLHAQLEARARELSTVAEQSAAALGYARSELERLSLEQEKAAVVEAHLGAFFANLNEQIQAKRLVEAGETIQSMRDFLNTPSFQGLRSIQARKELYRQTIDSFESMIAEARTNGAPPAATGKLPNGEAEQALAALQEQYAAMEQTLEEKNRTIEAFSSEGSGLARRLTELENQAGALRTLNSALTSSADEKDRAIAALETEKAGLNRTITSIRAENTAAIAAQETTINELRSQNAAQEERISSLDTQLTSLRQALQTLSQ